MELYKSTLILIYSFNNTYRGVKLHEVRLMDKERKYTRLRRIVCDLQSEQLRCGGLYRFSVAFRISMYVVIIGLSRITDYL